MEKKICRCRTLHPPPAASRMVAWCQAETVSLYSVMNCAKATAHNFPEASMNYELISAEDYDNLPDEPELKFVEIDRIC